MSRIPAEAKRRILELACEYADNHTDSETGTITTKYRMAIIERETVYAAIAYFLTGEPERIEKARAMLRKMGTLREPFSLMGAMIALLYIDDLLDDEVRTQFRESIRAFIGVPREDIIAGRNINIPLQAWTARLAAGLWFDRPDLVEQCAEALAGITRMVADHGTLPEFNSPVYHGITLPLLRIIVDLGEPQTAAMAARLEEHLWEELAWRFHPRLRVIAGPYGRIYHDGLSAGFGVGVVLLAMTWDAFHAPPVAYDWDHGHEYNMGGPYAAQVEHFPNTHTDIARNKALPVTVISRAEQVDFLLGDAWTPGGTAELSTFLDENLAVGAATRGHVHGMQSAVWLAHWSRTGQPIERLDDLGAAWPRFVQNHRRPGVAGLYRCHQRGESFDPGRLFWPDDGRAFALHAGPRAVILYQPKNQERRYVRELEAFIVFPRVNTVDAVYVDGARVDGDFEGEPGASVVVQSGTMALGFRACALDPELTTPRLVVERSHGHLFAGLRLVSFPYERELPELEYRRYGASFGTVLRPVADQTALDALIAEMQASVLTDVWYMGDEPVRLGGSRNVRFESGGAVLEGRFAPVAETWLSRRVPVPPGEVRHIRFKEADPVQAQRSD